MKKTGEFSFSANYFENRERRLMEEIERTQAELVEAKGLFDERIVALKKQREQVVNATAELRVAQTELENYASQARHAIREMTVLAMQCETLSSDVSAFLVGDDQALDEIKAQIADLEEQLARKTAKPEHKLLRLEEKLARLQWRRDVAVRQAEVERFIAAGEK